MDDRRTPPIYLPNITLDSPDSNNASTSQQSLHFSRPVLRYRKPGWKIRTFNFELRIREYPIQKMRCVSLAQMCVGLVCLCFSVVVIAVHAWGYQIGVGIWGGALFTLAGGIGIVAYLSLKLEFVWSTFLLSTAAFLVAFVLFVVSCVGIEQDLQSLHDLEREEAPDSLKIVGASNIIEQYKLRVGFNGVLLFTALIELILSLAQALLNGRYFFVWDEGCTSDSPHVYTNQGGGVEMDSPPTYQEAISQSSAPVTGADNGDSNGRYIIPGLTADEIRYRMMESPPIYSDSLEIQLDRERNARIQHDEPHRTRQPLGSPADIAQLGFHHFTPAPKDPPDWLPSNTEVLHDGPDTLPHNGLRIGRGYPRGVQLAGEPMYRRPQRPVDSIHANIHHCNNDKLFHAGPNEDTHHSARTDWQTYDMDMIDHRPAHSHSSSVEPHSRDIRCHDRLRPLPYSYSASVNGDVEYCPREAGVITDVESHM